MPADTDHLGLSIQKYICGLSVGKLTATVSVMWCWSEVYNTHIYKLIIEKNCSRAWLLLLRGIYLYSTWKEADRLLRVAKELVYKLDKQDVDIVWQFREV